MSKFRLSLTYCQAHGRAPLPACPSAIAGYILWEQQRRSLKHHSLQKCLSAVGSVHRVAGYDDPTSHFIVKLCVYGYRQWSLEEAGGELALQRLPLPASYILHVCDLGRPPLTPTSTSNAPALSSATSYSTGRAPRRACVTAT